LVLPVFVLRVKKVGDNNRNRFRAGDLPSGEEDCACSCHPMFILRIKLPITKSSEFWVGGELKVAFGSDRGGFVLSVGPMDDSDRKRRPMSFSFNFSRYLSSFELVGEYQSRLKTEEYSLAVAV
jgi:hypothetical protein